jgi:YD repeat-containing protein
MKRIITLFIFSIIFFFYFVSCKSTDTQPNTSTVLKSISYNLSSLKGKSGGKLLLEYSGTDIIKTSSVDTTYDTPKVISSNTQSGTYSNKILTKLIVDYKTLSATTQFVYDIKKTGNTYDITSKTGTYQFVTQIEVNANDQIIKFKDIKTITLDAKGQPVEILGTIVRRYEYDAKGNLIKAFSNQNSSKEYLAAEWTYDSNPSVYGALKWIFSGRIGNTYPLGESKNNPITAKTYTSGGNIEDNYTIVYVYDKTTTYPTSSTWTNKTSSGQVLSTNKYAFGY